MKTFLVLFFISGILIPNFIFAQFTQQGTKLVGEGAAGNAYQGSSIAISSDGGTAIIGGSHDSNGTGAAWVFTSSNGVWTQQGQKLVGLESDQNSRFGFSVAISADGNTAVMGSPGGYAGSAYIFTRSNGVWTQQGSKLVGSNSSQGSSLGHAVAISADGNTVVISGNGDEAIWVFTRSNGVWSQQGDKLRGTGGTGLSTNYGCSVSVSADGNTIVVGGSHDAYSQGAGQGAMWVFTRKNGVWSQQGPKLVSHESAVYASQGSSVAISADGNTFVEGGPTNNGEEGGIWIFTRTDTVWTAQGGWLVGFGDIGDTHYPVWAPVLQGSSVAISADGNTVVEGGYGDNGGIGAVWVFTRTGGVWSQDYPGSKLVGSGSVGATIYQGVSVAISGDGKTILEGGNGDNGHVGAAWAFSNPITGVTENDITTRSRFSLEQNYPNPFNPTTVISYQLPVGSNVTLKVYDILGKEIATLVNEEKSAGSYEVEFNVAYESLRAICSGVYFYQLRSGDFIQIKKMIFLK